MDHSPEDDATRVQTRILTPAEVHNIAFKKPTIGRRGYDEEEVDNFLDIVEGELVRLIEDNERLKNHLSSAPLDASQLTQVTDQDLIAENKRLSEALTKVQDEHVAALSQLRTDHSVALDQAQQAQGDLGSSHAQLQEALRAAEQRALQAEQAAAAAQQEAAAAKANSGAAVSADHHTQAVKVLALAQQTADQHLAGAQAEAEGMVKDAQETAAKLHQESTAAADRRVNDAQTRADAIKADIEARAAKTIEDAESHAKNVNDALETRKSALESRLEELGTFEREYRSRLKSYLESQLRDLEHGGSDDGAVPVKQDATQS